jgi:hypothetical protein
MLSLTKGVPIAKLLHTNKIIHVFDPDNMEQGKPTTGGWHRYGSIGGKEDTDDDFFDTASDDSYSESSEAYHSDESSEEEKYVSKKKIPIKKNAVSRKNDIGIIGTKYNCLRGQQLMALPNLESRSVDYVAGPSGKSTISANMATEFKRQYPRRPIYIFSRTDARDDPAYKHLKPKQIDLDTLIDYPIDITNEIQGGCLMIFDDCQTIQNPILKKEVDKLMEDCMEIGRKLGCWMIISNHLVIPNEKKLARTIMNEMHSLTIFPKSGSSQQIRYALKTYFGLSNKQIDEILALKSRWVKINKSYPMYVVHSGGVYIL